jgi:hypothetical protein
MNTHGVPETVKAASLSSMTLPSATSLTRTFAEVDTGPGTVQV